jgi:hypothetical protein
MQGQAAMAAGWAGGGGANRLVVVTVRTVKEEGLTDGATRTCCGAPADREWWLEHGGRGQRRWAPTTGGDGRRTKLRQLRRCSSYLRNG